MIIAATARFRIVRRRTRFLGGPRGEALLALL
jgi:hypothetical protein